MRQSDDDVDRAFQQLMDRCETEVVRAVFAPQPECGGRIMDDTERAELAIWAKRGYTRRTSESTT